MRLEGFKADFSQLTFVIILSNIPHVASLFFWSILS